MTGRLYNSSFLNQAHALVPHYRHSAFDGDYDGARGCEQKLVGFLAKARPDPQNPHQLTRFRQSCR